MSVSLFNHTEGKNANSSWGSNSGTIWGHGTAAYLKIIIINKWSQVYSTLGQMAGAETNVPPGYRYVKVFSYKSTHPWVTDLVMLAFQN